MNRDSPTWDYVFVSDLHLSLGYSQDRRAYHPREDFFFDEVFFRWLRWLDAECAADHRWELVIVGDMVDFLPVDERSVSDYLRERTRRRKAVNLDNDSQVARYWEEQFAARASVERVPERVQRLLFEDDVLDGRIGMEFADREVPRSPTPDAGRVPSWALEMLSRYRPSGLRRAQAQSGTWRFGLAESPVGDSTALGKGMDQSGDRTARGTQTEAKTRRQSGEFERRYGFLPTPERSAQKLDAIHRGHPVFFRALAWFVGLGHRVVIVRGNHDLELYWPVVQERFRQYVANEFSAAFHETGGHYHRGSTSPDLGDRIRFQPGWFYYRRGAFYAEHGCQYDLISASANPIRPLLPGNRWMMNPDVGSLAVICLHNHLESQFPELENEANYGASLLDLMRRDPVRIAAMLGRRAADFVRMAQRLWLAGHAAVSEQVPNRDDLAYCAGPSGLTPALVRAVFEVGAKPLLLRERLAWLLFSPAGHFVKLAGVVALAGLLAGLLALYYLVVAPAIASLLPASVIVTVAGPTIRLLGKVLLWLVPPLAYAAFRRSLGKRLFDDPLFRASSRIHRILHERDPALRHVIMGHSHRADVRPIALRADGRHVYHINTGTWTPTFAEGRRRLQTLGREVEFTFLRLVRGIRGYEADLLRWNDSAGRADPQIVPPDVA